MSVLELPDARRADTVDSPGFFSRLKEKGAMAKDAWGVIGSA